MFTRARLAWSWTALILLACWTPKAYMGRVEAGPRPFFIPNLDKLVHLGIFFGFAYLWMGIGSSKDRAWWVLAAGLLLTVATELGQMIPFVNRDATVGDGLADMGGVVLGIAACGLVRLVRAKRAVQDQS